MAPTNDELKQRLIAEATNQYARLAQTLELGEADGTCLYWALAVIIASQKEQGLRVIPQAGTASFRRIPRDRDDVLLADGSKPHTHFSYMWDDDADDDDIADQLDAGVLPEMHVWCALPDSEEIIDLSTPAIPACCERLGGLSWDMPPPPPLFSNAWTPTFEWHYVPTERATRLAVNIMQKTLLMATKQR